MTHGREEDRRDRRWEGDHGKFVGMIDGEAGTS